MNNKDAVRLEAEMVKLGLSGEEHVTRATNVDAWEEHFQETGEDTDCDCEECHPIEAQAAEDEGHRIGFYGQGLGPWAWGCYTRRPWPRRMRHCHWPRRGGCGQMAPWMMGGAGMGPMGPGPDMGPATGTTDCTTGRPGMTDRRGMGPCGPRRWPRHGFGRWCQAADGDDSAAGESSEKHRAKRQKRRQENIEKSRSQNDPAAEPAGETSDKDEEELPSFLPPWMRRMICLKERMDEAEGAKKEKIREKMQQLAMKRGLIHQQQMQAEESSSEEDNDLPPFVPPWVRRMIMMKQRMDKAEGPRKEKIRQRIRQLVMKRAMIAQYQQQQMQMQAACWWQPMGPAPFMGPPFAMRPWWMRSSGKRFEGARWWASTESDSERTDTDSGTQPTGTVTPDAAEARVPEAEDKCGRKVTFDVPSLDDDADVDHVRKTWIKEQKRRWAKRNLMAAGAPWAGHCGAPIWHTGPAGPGLWWWTEHHRPGMWKKMRQQHQREAEAAESEKAAAAAEVQETAERISCNTCQHRGPTK